MALKLKHDKEGSFFKVLEEKSLTASKEKKVQEGWLHKWEIAE